SGEHDVYSPLLPPYPRLDRLPHIRGEPSSSLFPSSWAFEPAQRHIHAIARDARFSIRHTIRPILQASNGVGLNGLISAIARNGGLVRRCRRRVSFPIARTPVLLIE